MARPLIVNEKFRIPESEFSLSFARSAGPGGQNVNKVNSKAVLRWNVAATGSLPVAVKNRFCERFARRINQAGEIVLASDQHREQARNVSNCYDKLRHLIESVLVAPPVRKKTRPTRASNERRLQQKHHATQRKQQRRQHPNSDD